jgi:Predicted nucleic acid-binding protein, contains PIN domain
MATEVVVDTSIIVALSTLEDRSSWARAKIAEYQFYHILDLSYYEVANALRYKCSEKFSAKQAEDAFTKSLELMNLFGVHSFGEVVVDALSLALEHKIAAYDAAFLCLADKLDLQLLTLDVKLAKKLQNTKYHRCIESPPE